MARNKLTDVNNHLFMALERLNDEDLKGDELKEELARAKAISTVSKQIINSSRTIIDSVKLVADGVIRSNDLNRLTGVNDVKRLDY
jgi:hypothetical protein